MMGTRQTNRLHASDFLGPVRWGPISPCATGLPAAHSSRSTTFHLTARLPILTGSGNRPARISQYIQLRDTPNRCSTSSRRSSSCALASAMARILFFGLRGFRFMRGICSRTGSSSSRVRARVPVASIVGSRCDPPLRCPSLPIGPVVQDTVPEMIEDRSIVLRSVAVQLAV